MNLIAPGTGLIAVGRPWLGVATAILFVTPAEIAVGGIWIAPATVSTTIIVGCSVFALTVWITAQWLVFTASRRAAGESATIQL